MKHPLLKLTEMRASGLFAGIFSACTANELVIEACIDRAVIRGGIVLVEATSNQVNQYGGYTGMKPSDFARFVREIADRRGLPADRVVLGGDHLGPLAWTSLPSVRAMPEAFDLVRHFVLAGFSKIHIDTSMRLADDDPSRELETEIIAKRAAELVKAAETAFAEMKSAGCKAPDPVYVIGSEVPIPGGAQENEILAVTGEQDFVQTVEQFKIVFEKAGLERVWERVLAIVVQPGVEFGDESIHEYDREAAVALTSRLTDFPGLVFEGHSTDYQRAAKLREMVEDGIAILKVGPALTFALREGLFALENIERELIPHESTSFSLFSEILEREMIVHPEHWQKHYHGTEETLRFKRRYSYSDRCRYYFPTPSVQASVDRLLENLGGRAIPDTLLSQFMPLQYSKVRSGELSKDPRSLVKDRIGNCIDDYLYATTSTDVEKNHENHEFL